MNPHILVQILLLPRAEHGPREAAAVLDLQIASLQLYCAGRTRCGDNVHAGVDEAVLREVPGLVLGDYVLGSYLRGLVAARSAIA